MKKGLTMKKQHSLVLGLLEIILVMAVVLGIIVLVINQMGRKTEKIETDKEVESVSEQAQWQERLEEVQALQEEQRARHERAYRDALGLEEQSHPDTPRRTDIQNMIQRLNPALGRNGADSK